jgi:glutamate synthase (NADPH/NADH) small chain
MKEVMSYEKIFCDLEEPLDLKTAHIESSRCYYCFDAPCIQACPTSIDIPSFIRKINHANVRGAALDILSSNILGGTCARACPVETLCQQACVREKSEGKPVLIGQLQRYATDEFFKTGEQPFKQGPSKGKKIAVVGAGPSGLSCSHKLATLGYNVTIFEANGKSGGLNEYGLAPYKMTDDFAQKEVAFVLGVGGIEIQHGKKLGRDFTIEDLKKDYAAVFLGIGLGSTHRLGIEGEDLPGVIDAVQHIAVIRQTQDTTQIPVAENVVVIGGGNTAVDIAIQMKRLGAESVTLVYRRGREQMGATHHEQELAQKNGVLLKTWAKPSKILGSDQVDSVEFENTELDTQGRLVGTGKLFKIQAGQVFKAIGQRLETSADARSALPEAAQGKFKVSKSFETTISGVFAGGDCIGAGEDLTVSAVQQGKQAAIEIDRKLNGISTHQKGDHSHG